MVYEIACTNTPTPTGLWYSPTPEPTVTPGGPTLTPKPTCVIRKPVVTMVNNIIWDDLSVSDERISSSVVPLTGPEKRLNDEHFYISYSNVKDGYYRFPSPTPTPYQNETTNIYATPLFAIDPHGDNYFLSSTASYESVDSPCRDIGDHSTGTPSFYVLPLPRLPYDWTPRDPTPTVSPSPVYLDEYTTLTNHTPDIGRVDLGYHHYPNTKDPGIPALQTTFVIFTVIAMAFWITWKRRNEKNR